MPGFSEQLANHAALNQLQVPDLWQHKAITHLRNGEDVIVHAPTGAGKTLIFELWANEGRNRGQAIYTVPTRALANDKLAEWRAKGWDVGITTGDLSDHIHAPVIVATLEAQKNRLLQGKGPQLLVIDEYQMIGDADRGLNYELAIAQAPANTQLLLLSGSVGNPKHVARWLQRLGRKAQVVSHFQRPVPLEEVSPLHFNVRLPRALKGYWPGLIAKALTADLGPILIFAPRRAAAESLANELARHLPNPNPLTLTDEQRHLVGDALAKTLSSRIAFHHSGLSYGARAGVVEPLAKAGQLRVVVATMGLAAGINFSLRSVSLAADSYRRQYVEHTLAPDEILQMLGRAGRRGIDETGYVIVSANAIRLRDGFPVDLNRSRLIDWSALLAIMGHAVDRGANPYQAAVDVQQRLFTTKPIDLGVESALAHPDVPCGLPTDPERARLVRKQEPQFRNSRLEWEKCPAYQEVPLADVFVPVYPEGPEAPDPAPDPENPIPLIPLLSDRDALATQEEGPLAPIREQNGRPIYGRVLLAATQAGENRMLLHKWLRRMIRWKGRYVQPKRWEEKIIPLLTKHLEQRQTPLVKIHQEGNDWILTVHLEQRSLRTYVDRYGIALWNPQKRQVTSPICTPCPCLSVCRSLPPRTRTALQWRRLGLIEKNGHPTRRGQIVSYFNQNDGLAIAAALETEDYSIADLIFDLADLDGGFRFCGDEDRWAGRLASACRNTFGSTNIEGYLENGTPPNYGHGAAKIVRALQKSPHTKHQWVTDLLGPGDIDRVIIEWRSRLRQIASAPEMDWPRWNRFQELASSALEETESPTLSELPRLPGSQQKRVNHRLHASDLKALPQS